MNDHISFEHKLMSFQPAEQRFRFAAWGAATAARASKNCRFPVSDGVELLKRVGLDRLASGGTSLPSPQDFDETHNGWCSELVRLAPQTLSKPSKKAFSYGVAAKLVNCYLKPLFMEHLLTGTENEERLKVNAIHPPIDSVLLRKLGMCDPDVERAKNWRRWNSVGWSNFEDKTYLAVIGQIRSVTAGELWRIEAFWTGHQTI